MGLSEQTIRLAFSGGVDTKTDPKAVPIVKLLALENGVFTRGGSIAKRNGYDEVDRAIDSGGTYTSGVAMAARGDEALLFADGRLLSRRPSSGTWSDVGAVSALTTTEAPIIKTGTNQTAADAWTADGLTVAAWEDSRGGIWAAVLEEATGRVLRAAEQLDALGTAPRVMRVGAAFHVYWLRAVTGEIWISTVNPASYLDEMTTAILTDGVNTTSPGYDVAATGRTGTPAVMTWPTASGDLRLSYVDGSGVLGSPVTGHPTGITIGGGAPDGAPVAVDWNGDRPDGQGIVAALSTSGADAGFFVRLDDDMASVVIDDMIADVSDTSAIRCTIALSKPPDDYEFASWIAVESASLLAQNAHTTFTRIRLAADLEIDNVTLDGVTRSLRGHGIASRLFSAGDAVLIVLAHAVPFFPYCPIVRMDDSLLLSTAGRLLVGVGNGLPARRVIPAVAPSTADAQVRLWPGIYREQLIADPTGLQFTETGIRQCRMDFADENALQSAPFGADLVIAGSCALRYDGDTVAELGFHTAPDGDGMTFTPSAGGALSESKTYSYRICYEEVDAAGEIHQGAMSIEVPIVLGVGQGTVTIEIPTYRLTHKRRVRIGVFRSLGNDDSALPRFRRVSSKSPSATGPNGFVANSTTVDTVTFVDQLSDDDLLLREEAYDNFGVLSNDPAPTGALIAGGKNRLFFSSSDSANMVRYTQQRREGYGADLSADLFLPFDPLGGAITAIGVLDDAVIVFKRGSIYFFAGPGPLPNPEAAPQISFGDPQLITSDVGCINPKSLAVTPVGIIFKAARGYHLIDRARQVSYIGAPVEAFNALNVTSAIALPNRTQILILHSDGSGLLFDYYFREWSIFTGHESLSACVAGEQFYLLRNDANTSVFKENRSSFLDGNREIRLYMETAWIRFAAYAQGWQKIWYALFLGLWKSSHVLRIRIATDYRAGWDDPIDIDVDSVNDPANYGDGPYGDGPYGGDSDTLYQSRIHVSEQCQAIRFSLEDASSGDAQLGASFEMLEMVLSGGGVRATVKPAATRST